MVLPDLEDADPGGLPADEGEPQPLLPVLLRPPAEEVLLRADHHAAAHGGQWIDSSFHSAKFSTKKKFC